MGVEIPRKNVFARSGCLLFMITFFLTMGAGAFGVTFLASKLIEKNQTGDTAEVEEVSDDSNVEGSTDDTGNEPVIEKIDFQSVVDAWVKTVNGNKSILIYDLDFDEVVGEYNAKETYGTASLYKLFVVYEGYKRVFDGTWNSNNKAGSTGKTISKCLDLAIRESHSPCAETLWGMIGRDNLDKIIETEWKITNSDISKLTSNALDIMQILKRFYEHPDFDDAEIISAMWDSFLNQPATTYDWRQGLPKGFKKASVYNKVGWDYNADKKYWNIYHDAAIVKFPTEDGKTRDFIVVVMTNKVDFKNIRKFGTMLEDKFYEK